MIDNLVYHKGCPDGFTAAWLISQHEKIGRWVPLAAGEDLPPMDGHCMIVDLGVDHSQLQKLDSYKVYDHHQSSQEVIDDPNCIIDYEECAASLVYLDYPVHSARWLVSYVRDRDLWLRQLPFHEEIGAVIDSWPRDQWGHLVGLRFNEIKKQGDAILRYREQCILGLMDTIQIKDNYAIVNCSNVQMISELGSRILEDTIDYVKLWRISSRDTVKVSLRSKRVDVAEIARNKGGGGHKLAAGYEVSLDEWYEELAEALSEKRASCASQNTEEGD